MTPCAHSLRAAAQQSKPRGTHAQQTEREANAAYRQATERAALTRKALAAARQAYETAATPARTRMARVRDAEEALRRTEKEAAEGYWDSLKHGMVRGQAIAHAAIEKRLGP